MKLKIKHQIDSKEVAAPSPKLGTADGLLLQSCIVALARATTAWGTTAIARWLVATVTLILRGIGFLLGLRQIDGALASLLCLEGSCLSNTTSHELKLRLVNQVLKVHARIEVDVHRLDVVLGKLLYRLRSLATQRDAEYTKRAQLNLVAIEQLLYQAVAHIR